VPQRAIVRTPPRDRCRPESGISIEPAGKSENGAPGSFQRPMGMAARHPSASLTKAKKILRRINRREVILRQLNVVRAEGSCGQSSGQKIAVSTHTHPGDGGSGKTWLANQLGCALDLPIIELDDFHWEPGYTGIARDKQLVADLVQNAALADQWIMEGVYGWLANIVLHRVTTLIWIDLPEAECIENTKHRGYQGGETEQAFEDQLKWIAEYRVRTNSNSFKAHAQLFSAHPGPKSLLKSRGEIAAHLEKALSIPPRSS
jgi:adenylate kinase family enzyme